MKTRIKNYIKEMRMKHYVKNLIIFFPLFFNGAVLEYTGWMPFILGILSFCVCASCIYIVNDIQDIEKDRKHGKKCKRPLAAGLITVTEARMLCGILGGVSLLFILLAVRRGAAISSIVVLLVYVGLNLIYSVFHLKDVALLDIIILASGFVLRLMMGSALTKISISAWLYLVVLCGAFYLGFGKRRNELRTNSDTTRKVLKDYTESYLTMSMYSCMSLTIVFFSLWCIEKQQSHIRFHYLWFVPIMMILFFQYNLDLEKEQYTGDPTEILFGDRVIQVVCIVTAILMYINIYV